MFNERTALKLRMEQLNGEEYRIIREFQNERDRIYQRLRELDLGKHELPSLRELAQHERNSGTAESCGEILIPHVNSIVRPKDQREVGVQFLSSKSGEDVKSVEIKRHVEWVTGESIQNMTYFMEVLMKEMPGLEKVGRGLYKYVKV